MAMYPCLSLPSLSFPSVSGAVCSFDSQYAGLPLKSHSVAVVGTQSGSGTPSPSNPRALNGWSSIVIIQSGKNLLESTMNVACALITDGVRIVSGGTSLICHLKKGMTYTISGVTINRGMIGFFDAVPSVNDETDRTQVIPNSGVSTFTSDYDGVAVIYINNGNVDISTAIIEIGNRATTYEPYNGTTTTIQIGSTIYGGNYDAVSGVLSVTWVKCQFGDLTWYKTSNFFRAEANLPLINGTNSKSNGYALANPYASQEDNIYLIFVQGGANQLSVLVRDLRYSDANTFKSAMENQDIYAIYELATPQTIQLPPCPIDTLEVNNIFADTGDTTLQYIKLG